MSKQFTVAALLATSIFTACGKASDSKPNAASDAPGAGTAEAADTMLLRGLIQYESPCVRADFAKGCLRLYVADVQLPGGNLKYIDRANRDNEGAEFNIVDNGPFAHLTTLYRLWYNSTDSVLLSQNQPVALTVRLDDAGTTIIDVLDVSVTGHY